MKGLMVLIGAVGAAVVVGLIVRARQEPRLPVYVVVVEMVCIAGFLFGAAFALTSWAEGEKQVVLKALLVFALPWVVAGVVIWWLGIRGKGSDEGAGSWSTESAEMHGKEARGQEP